MIVEKAFQESKATVVARQVGQVAHCEVWPQLFLSARSLSGNRPVKYKSSSSVFEGREAIVLFGQSSIHRSQTEVVSLLPLSTKPINPCGSLGVVPCETNPFSWRRCEWFPGCFSSGTQSSIPCFSGYGLAKSWFCGRYHSPTLRHLR